MTSNDITPEPASHRISLPRLHNQPDGSVLATAHCTIVAVDIVGFGHRSRTDANRVRIRRGFYQATQHAFDAAGVPWESCRREDLGDGIVVIAPANIPKTSFVDLLPGTMLTALLQHNRTHPPTERIRLRLALHAGEVNYDEHGFTGTSIMHAFRLLDSAAVRTASAEKHALLAVIGSSWFFDEVIRHSEHSDAHDYAPADVISKETRTRAWIRVLFERSRSRRRVDSPERISPRQLYALLEHHADDGARYDSSVGLAKLAAWMAEDADQTDIPRPATDEVRALRTSWSNPTS
ncbi:hypothetical protein AB0J55_28590 [Amycolatopsis sp. NPDC049688]|uniref:hypothetical protein n=1 Tax=Amycolatopsis sp. NPDC049688 TaxID=3154733 RepID=UPI003416E94C